MQWLALWFCDPQTAGLNPIGVGQGNDLFAPPSHNKLLQHKAFSSFQEEEVQYCHVITPTLSKTTFFAHRFFLYSFTASDGSEGNIADSVV